VIVDTEKLLGRPGDERTRIEAALAQSNGKVSGAHGAAVKLGMPPSTLESRIRSLKINKSQFKGV
jgi:formate hydrogenlyase transcriptional activator